MIPVGWWMGLGILLTVWPLSRAHAQWPAEIAPGARIQIRLPEAEFQATGRRGHLLRGRVARLAHDSLYLAVTDSVGPLAIPRTLIQRIDYSRGVPSRMTSALLRGVGLGVGSALLFALLNEIDDDSAWSAGEAALLGGGLGFTIGAIVGALRPEERWRRVHLGVAAPAPF